MAKGTQGWVVGLYVLGMLITGTMNTLCTKIQFTLSSVGIDGKPELFQKPWFATLDMLGAMGLVGVVDYMVRKWCSRRSGKDLPLLADEAPKVAGTNGQSNGRSYAQKAALVSVPAAFDIAATALCAFGMLYIPASVWQMLRGSSIVFAAMFSIIFLKRKMYSFNWLGLLLCVVGVTVVGLANVWGADTQSSGPAPEGMVFGMLLVIAGQVVQAAQIIAEEFLLKSVDLPGFQIIGLEGFWGTCIMLMIVYPLLWAVPGPDHGHQEDLFDTFALLSNSPPLLMCVLTYLFSCGTFNATGIMVTEHLSGVHRMMLDASRTVLIWCFGLWVHYYLNPESLFGEVWTPYSWLQLVGFAVLVSGQAIYGEVLKVPGLTYPAPNLLLSSPTPSAARHLATPLPRQVEAL
mmetsp:Transcript_14970/g.41837  ORF Transcript_14970/g.41837 Transcript_14970/m.41837 type:complete len:404 (-) Transcript_14970:75-1286(-)|eukprot:CAMPEP_0177345376 /NCGR_PEP_ID=MMETSP0368-20130122/28614_1 /TAXON_ID=447022 ORGANISM="Scrippsiella hangoei-like, Strain SHHI-4" /NCGR_SAMPLE_ID=MMETSP0368 /ASSEMBLY_ACC=CAM_ASM_000363 /LENGTH=403 /DNA_ID=CAMNT_0018806947 /DNA_START=53 /DNA_END=1264 /DNA_ORIENTATION=+